MSKIWGAGGVLFSIFLAGCDLQPRILSFPDTVGEFISTRYPALLADPVSQPEIYNSAAADYGMYASPQLYGSLDASDEYVTYASINDYIVPPQDMIVTAQDVTQGAEIINAPDGVAADDYLRVPMYGNLRASVTEVTVAPGDTLYSIAKKYNTNVDALAKVNDLSAPYILRVGQTLCLPGKNIAATNPTESKSTTTPAVVSTETPGRATTTRVGLRTVTVAAGDTLYSLSRRYSVPVNDLAVMNNLTAPFSLRVGQNLRIPDLAANSRAVAVAPTGYKDTSSVSEKKPTPQSVRVENISVKSGTQTKTTPQNKTTMQTKTGSVSKSVTQGQTKISSDPTKKLPTISARSSSKFSWPVRGTILSHYGAKSGGLFNDGINIGASRGTPVSAAENGVVAYAGNEVKGMGNLIIIQHSDGWMTVYAHMDSMSVRRGARVSVRQKIGTVGSTGKVDKPQLHFEIRKGTRAYNPSQYLKK